MQIVIDIPKKTYEQLKFLDEHGILGFDTIIDEAIANGTPLDKHDEEVIKETVESIWGKPPYIELLDRLRDEIENYDNFIICANGQKGIHIDKALEIIDKYKAESEDK